MAGSTDKRKAVCVIYLISSRALDTMSHSMLVGTLRGHKADASTFKVSEKLAGSLHSKDCVQQFRA